MFVIIGPWDALDSGFLYWSNVDGWGSRSTADVFTNAERRRLTLPMGGKWVSV